ncbi:MAG: type II toxin-antitoxin system Phd/YefM family antitoxin [bacterium]|nr:type II toxin-antitoxin system Phd/YefM family antitoxin [bacterium]
MTTETLSLTELRPRLPELVERATQFFDRFLITRHGRAEAVLMAADDFEGLLETIDILSDNECLQRLADAEAELARGGGHSLESVRRELPDAAGSD